MKHQYKVTVEEISPSDSSPTGSVQFCVENHDDVFAIINRLEQRPDFSEEDAKAFGLGLKLFSEVMLKNKSAPLFADFLPHFVDFMKTLKKG